MGASITLGIITREKVLTFYLILLLRYSLKHAANAKLVTMLCIVLTLLQQVNISVYDLHLHCECLNLSVLALAT